MGLFDSAPDEQRRRLLDFLASSTGAPDSLVRPPEQQDPAAAPAALPAPPAEPLPAAPPPAAPTADHAHDRAFMDEAIGRYQGAQAQDRGQREQIRRGEILYGLLGNPMDTKKLNVDAAGDVANEIGLRHHMAQEGRLAEKHPYDLSQLIAKTRQEQATAALTSAKVPYAGDVEQAKADKERADARQAGAHADVFQQSAAKGAADLAFEGSFRDAIAKNDPSVRPFLLAEAQKLYPHVDRETLESTHSNVLWHMLPEGMKRYAADKAAEAAHLRIETSQNRTDVHRVDDLAKRMSQGLDPYARGGGLKGSMDIVNRAKRLKTLILDEKGQPRNLDRRQMEEVAIGLNSLLSGSSSGAQSQVEALVPHTIWGDVKKLQERISNEPTGLDQGKFVSRLLETIEREEGVTQKTVREAVKARLPEFAPLRDLDRDRYQSILRARGLEPDLFDEQGLEKGGGGAALTAEDQQAKAWADANPKDPRAAKILERLTGKGP